MDVNQCLLGRVRVELVVADERDSMLCFLISDDNYYSPLTG